MLGCALLIAGTAPPAGIEAQVSGMPGVGIVVANVTNTNVAIASYGAPLTGDSPFEIGSITKTFTATLFADMIVRREVAPEDTIQRYLPAGVIAPTYNGKPMTLADLATQSSGLPRMPDNFAPANPQDPYADYSDARLFAFLMAYKLQRAPGATFEYSNLGFGLLGNVLARRLGVDYATAIRTRILEPLHMFHTFLEARDHPANTAGGHNADGDPVPNWNQAALAGAGAIVSTPNDMAAYAQANLDPSSGPLAAAMRLAQQPLRPAGAGRRIGYAWISQPDGIVWHNGGTGGFRSFLGLDPAGKRAILVLANGLVNAVDDIGFHALDPAIPLPSPPKPDFFVQPALMQQYSGSYAFSDGSTGIVSRDPRGLLVSFDKPLFHARLHARSSTEFAILSPPIEVRFNGTGSSLTMAVQQGSGEPDIGKRLP